MHFTPAATSLRTASKERMFLYYRSSLMPKIRLFERKGDVFILEFLKEATKDVCDVYVALVGIFKPA